MSTERQSTLPRHSLSELIEQMSLKPGPSRVCPYLHDRQAREVAFRLPHYIPGLYHGFMDLNFRRSGTVLYRPQCETCNQCQAIRLPIADFHPNRSQRRCLKRNRDLSVSVGRAVPDDEK